MNNDGKQHASFSDVWIKLKDNFKRNWKKYIRAGIIVSLVYVFVIIFLGVGFFLIAVAAWLIVRTYFPYWKPAYKFLVWLMGADDDFIDPFPARFHLVRLPSILIISAMSVYLVYIGVMLIATHDFAI